MKSIVLKFISNVNYPVYIIKNTSIGYTIVDTYQNTTETARTIKVKGRINNIRAGEVLKGKFTFTDTYEPDKRDDGEFYVGDLKFTDKEGNEVQQLVPGGFIYIVT